MRNRTVLFLSLVFILSITGCGSKPADYGDDYVFGQDCQTFDMGCRSAVYTDNGFYALNPDNRQLLYCIDKAGNKAKPLCNKPECNHNKNLNGEECNAFFNHILSINYFDNNIYVVTSELDEKSAFVTNLYRLSPDGSNRELVCCLFEESSKEYLGEDEASYSLDFIIHRGMGYMAINWMGDTSKEYEQILYKVPLNGDSISELTAYKGYDPVIHFSYTQGNNIFFYLETRSKETGERSGREYCLNIMTDNITEVELPDKHIFISDSDNKNITMKRNDDGSTTIYKSTGMDDAVEIASIDYDPVQYSDYKYIYFDNMLSDSDKNILEIMDYTGAINNSIEVDGSALCSDTKDILYYDSSKKAYALYDINTGQKKDIDTEIIEINYNP